MSYEFLQDIFNRVFFHMKKSLWKCQRVLWLIEIDSAMKMMNGMRMAFQKEEFHILMLRYEKILVQKWLCIKTDLW